MIAEALASALPGYRHISIKRECGREESFAELFPLMDDKRAQDEARARTPALRHCNLLAGRSDACLLCSLDTNPFKGLDARSILAAINHAELAEDALDLYAQWQLGGLNRDDLRRMALEEITALDSAVKFMKSQESEELANRLSVVIARLFAGPKSNG